MSYESPIKVIVERLESKIENEIENEIFSAVQKVGVHVDKEELIRALKYDRDQYWKGYHDRDKEIAQCNNEQAEQEENL